VWSALSDPTQLARWLGEFNGDLRPDAVFHARLFASGWEGSGRVQMCNAPQRLLVIMRESGGEDEDATDVELRPEGDRTFLVVEQRGLPLDQLAAYGAGLQVHVEDLAAHLRSDERCDGPARWKELFPTYAAKPVDAG
jgi:uncharacterized protein YndB with AHSA1/START domain